MNNNVTKYKKHTMNEITGVSLVFTFPDNDIQIVPLTRFQRNFLITMLGCTINAKTGKIEHFTDKNINDIYKLVTPELIKILLETKELEKKAGE